MALETLVQYKPDVERVTLRDASEEQLSTVRYFGFFSREEITQNAGQLLMLDIDFGRDCSLKCPTCFRRKNAVDDSDDKDLSYDEMLSVINEARSLGLREIKICGAGEPFENPDLLRLARQLTEWNVGLSIFTKGHVLGDDNLASNIFFHEGIRSAYSLSSVLFDLNTSILVGFQSFKQEIQDKLVGNVMGHTERRNRAVENLCRIGFNKEMPTRIALCTNPITRDNLTELFDIYTFCRERNILPIIAALMVSGKQFNETYLNNIDVTNEEKYSLYSKIYEYNIENRVQSLKSIMEYGISPMAGIHPCNQIATGLYITCNGNVVSCPGNTMSAIGNVRQESLSSIWKHSENCTRQGIFNCFCPPKAGKTLPDNLYSEVLMRLKKRYSFTVSQSHLL